jgi:hypothetical protein
VRSDGGEKENGQAQDHEEEEIKVISQTNCRQATAAKGGAAQGCGSCSGQTEAET